MHEVLVNRLGGLSLPRKSVVRLTDRPDMTFDVYRGRKTTMQQQQLTTAEAECESLDPGKLIPPARLSSCIFFSCEGSVSVVVPQWYTLLCPLVSGSNIVTCTAILFCKQKDR